MSSGTKIGPLYASASFLLGLHFADHGLGGTQQAKWNELRGL